LKEGLVEENYLSKKHKEIIKHLNFTDGEIVIEIGCGTGYYISYLSQRLKHSMIVATDVSYEALLLCRKKIEQEGGRSQVGYMVCDAEALPFKDKTFAGILMTQVIEHLPDDENGLKEANRIAKSGVNFVIATDNQHNYISRAINLPVKLVRTILNKKVDQIPFHKAYSLSNFYGMLIREGFEVNHFYTFRFSIAINPSLKIAHFINFILNQLEKALIRLPWIRNWGDIILAYCQKPE